MLPEHWENYWDSPIIVRVLLYYLLSLYMNCYAILPMNSAYFLSHWENSVVLHDSDHQPLLGAPSVASHSGAEKNWKQNNILSL